MILNILLFLFGYSLTYRYESFNLWKSRYSYYERDFELNNQNNNLKLKYNHEKGFYCKVKKSINSEDTIFKINSNSTISVYDYFPFKSKFYNIITEMLNNTNAEDDILSSVDSNTINKVLLSIRFLFEIKANHTESFIQLKRFESNRKEQTEDDINFLEYKKYVIFKNNNDQLYKFFAYLPLHYMYSQTAFYADGYKNYLKTGYYNPNGILAESLIQALIKLISSDSKYTEFHNIVSHWFNQDNYILLKLCYAYIQSRGINQNYSEYINLQTDNEFNKQVNKLINNNGNSTSPLILPSLSLCNNYHPTENEKKYELRSTKIENKSNYYIVSALSNYNNGEEFSISYSTDLTNDNYLLNYGFVEINNTFQIYSFHINIPDNNWEIYNSLVALNKTNHISKDLINNKTLVDFYLKRNKIDSLFINLISKYVAVNNLFNSTYIKNKHTLNDYSVKTKNLVYNYILYYQSITNQIRKIFESKVSHKSSNPILLINEIIGNIKLIDQIQSKIDSVTDNQISSEDYIKVDRLIKENNLLKFHMDNIHILLSHEKLICNKISSLYWTLVNTNKLKNKYIN